MSINRKIRDCGRKFVDRFYYKQLPHTLSIGNQGCSWPMNLKALTSKPILFSGGIGHDMSFEIAFAKDFDGLVHVYDPSPTGKATWLGQKTRPSEVHFHAAALAGNRVAVTMAQPQDQLEGSWRYSTNFEPAGGGTTFPSCVLTEEIRNFKLNSVDVIKLDIEGFEYEVLADLLESDLFIGQILVEFHDFFPDIPRSKTKSSKQLLAAKGYQCFYKARFDHCFIHKSLLKNL